ncbi:hypothetical protein [Roseovarius gaetbuli]|uniref:hypothetical protein n=1 Tax=Roseovarius gaetbuli TaxID=1356575 RepID=UPI00148383D5|nr:hypothetical protein [Roseovarius gaetbuli]
MADHDKLIRRLNQMKAATLDLLHKAVSANLAINPREGPSHHSALSRRFGGKQLSDPGLIRGMAGHHVHARYPADSRLIQA